MDLGLILQEHLALRDRAVEFARQRAAIESGGADREIANHRLALGAGMIERALRFLDQPHFLGIAERCGRATDHDFDAVWLSVEVERFVEQGDDPAGQRLEIDQGIAAGGDFELRPADFGQPQRWEGGEDAVADIDHQHVGARDPDMTTQRDEVGDFDEPEKLPVLDRRRQIDTIVALTGIAENRQRISLEAAKGRLGQLPSPPRPGGGEGRRREQPAWEPARRHRHTDLLRRLVHHVRWLAPDVERTLKPTPMHRETDRKLGCFILNFQLIMTGARLSAQGRKRMLRFILALIYGDNIRPW